MSGERDVDAVVRVGPGGVVIGDFARQGHSIHEPPGLGEIAEFERSLQ